MNEFDDDRSLPSLGRPSGSGDPIVAPSCAVDLPPSSPGGLETILGGLRDADMRADLGRIGVPTVVMHRRGDRAVRFEAGQHLAHEIPGAVWHPFEGVDHFWWCGDGAAVVEAILRFAAT